MFREMDRVAKGLDPKGIVREAAENEIIDTHLMESIREMNFWREGRDLPESLRV
jgi:hypothetical protein